MQRLQALKKLKKLKLKSKSKPKLRSLLPKSNQLMATIVKEFSFLKLLVLGVKVTKGLDRDLAVVKSLAIQSIAKMSATAWTTLSTRHLTMRDKRGTFHRRGHALVQCDRLCTRLGGEMTLRETLLTV